MKNICYFLFLFPLVALGQTNIVSIQDVISGLENAVQKKDTSLLTGVIADNFGINAYTWPSSGRPFLQIVNRPERQIESIKLHSDEIIPVTGNKKKVRVSIKETGKEPFESDIYLNSNNQILYVDYFDQLFGKNRYDESRLQALLPFSLSDNGSIVLSIRLNDNSKPLRFLFDSGADGMAISKSLADSLGLKVSSNQETSVVGGNMNINISSGNTVFLDTLQLTNQSIAIFDKMREGIDGLIGLNLAKLFITKFDFDKMELSLYNFGTYTYEKEGETMSIILPNGIPIVPGSLDLVGAGYVDGNFAFDTGASYYLLGFSPFVRKNKLLLSGFKPESQTSTVSMGKSTPTFNGKCQDFKMNHIHLKEMPVSLQAGSNWNPGADGSLGIKFISRNNFTINLLEKEIHLTPNKRAGFPL